MNQFLDKIQWLYLAVAIFPSAFIYITYTMIPVENLTNESKEG